MKFQFKAIITCSLITLSLNPLHARDIILLENLGTNAEGEVVLNILQKKFNLPRRLITYKNKNSCNKNSEAIMHLCLKANGELDIVKMNKFVVEETLGVFLETEE